MIQVPLSIVQYGIVLWSLYIINDYQYELYYKKNAHKMCNYILQST